MKDNIPASIFNNEHIAPCGMNCGVCIAYLRERKPCGGCRLNSENKPQHCITCRIVNCDELAKTKTGFCFECKKFPCLRLKQLDYRYRKNYRTSLIANLKQIQLTDIDIFLNQETVRWTCPFCGKITSIHRDSCLACKKLIKPGITET